MDEGPNLDSEKAYGCACMSKQDQLVISKDGTLLLMVGMPIVLLTVRLTF